MSTAHAGWEITGRREMKTGVYFVLNVKSLGRPGTSVVTVKARSLVGGPPYVCLSCIKNDCAHIDFVAEHDTPDRDSDGLPRNYPARSV